MTPQGFKIPVGRFFRNVFMSEKTVSIYCGNMMIIRLSSILLQVLLIGAAVSGAYLVGRAVTGTPLNQLWALIGIFTVLTIASILLQHYNMYLSHVIGFGAVAGMRKAIYEKFDELAPAYIIERRSGDLARSALSDVGLLELYIAHTLPDLWSAIVVPPLILLLMVWFHWSLALILAPFLLLAATVPDWLSRRAEAQGRQLRHSSGEMTSEIVEGIQGLRETVLFNAIGYRLGRLNKSLDKYASAFIGHMSRSGFERGASDTLLSLGTLATTAMGAYLVTRGQLNPAYLPAAMVLAGMAFLPVTNMTTMAQDLNKSAAAAERVFNILHARPSVTDLVTSSPVIELAPEVRFSGINFSYRPGLPEALHDVSFTVPAGKTTALVGHSGAGKSTCTYLLLRLWDPQTGSITLDGHDLREFRQEDLRQVIAYVPQDVYLFNMSVLENIRIGRGDATEEEVKEAARRACAFEFIEELPEKWDTSLGERGSLLSGGQRQRIAIARALIKDSPVIIMDEAVSNLDTESEAAIRKAVAEVSRGRTTIIVAHRPSTIRSTDHIVHVESGQVVETGTYEELIAARGKLAALIGAG